MVRRSTWGFVVVVFQLKTVWRTTWRLVAVVLEQRAVRRTTRGLVAVVCEPKTVRRVTQGLAVGGIKTFRWPTIGLVDLGFVGRPTRRLQDRKCSELSVR